MRKLIVVIALMFSISLFCNEIFENKINVIGNAELKITADGANLNFTVKGYGPTLRKAVEVAKETVNEVLNDLLIIGIDKKDLSTLDFYSGHNYGRKPFLKSKKDYRTDITTNIVIDSLEILEEIILTLSDNKIENISNVKFTLKDHEKYKKECRGLALQNAKEKAEQIAKELNTKIIGIYYVEELNSKESKNVAWMDVMTGGLAAEYGKPSNAYVTYQDDSINSYDSLFSGKIKISSFVSVIFILEN